jgi:hypothetical protein
MNNGKTFTSQLIIERENLFRLLRRKNAVIKDIKNEVTSLEEKLEKNWNDIQLTLQIPGILIE